MNKAKGGMTFHTLPLNLKGEGRGFGLENSNFSTTLSQITKKIGIGHPYPRTNKIFSFNMAPAGWSTN